MIPPPGPGPPARMTHHTKGNTVQHTDQSAWDYIDTIADTLTNAGVKVTDQWAQEDDGHHEGLIVIGDQDEAFAWHDEKGWRHLTGPGSDFSPYSNVTDLLDPDAAAPDVIAKLRDLLGFTADAQALIDPMLAAIRTLPAIDIREVVPDARGRGFDGIVVCFAAEDRISGWVGRLHTAADGQTPWQVSAAQREETGLHARHDAYPASLVQVPGAITRVVSQVAADLATF